MVRCRNCYLLPPRDWHTAYDLFMYTTKQSFNDAFNEHLIFEEPLVPLENARANLTERCVECSWTYRGWRQDCARSAISWTTSTDVDWPVTPHLRHIQGKFREKWATVDLWVAEHLSPQTAQLDTSKGKSAPPHSNWWIWSYMLQLTCGMSCKAKTCCLSCPSCSLPSFEIIDLTKLSFHHHKCLATGTIIC
jgi:hypothetical protein